MAKNKETDKKNDNKEQGVMQELEKVRQSQLQEKN